MFRGNSVRTSVAALLLTVLAPHICSAGQLTGEPDGGTTWKAGIDGVEIEWNPDHSIKRVYSLKTQPVNFPDQRGVMKAQIIAEEKAKAAIIEFMHQSVSSSKVVKEIDNDVQTSTRSQGSGTPEAISRNNERTMIENLTEVTASFASGSLTGVVVLERGYDEKTEEAWTKVGISQKTMAAAQALHQATTASNSSLGGQEPDQAKTAAGPPTGPTGIPRPSSEDQKSNQPDW